MRSLRQIVSIIAIAYACLLSIAHGSAQAALLTWTFKDVVLQETADSMSPGTTYNVSGSFLYDAQTKTVKDWKFTAVEAFDRDLPCFGPTTDCPNTAVQTTEPGGIDMFAFEHSEGSPGASPTFTLLTPQLTDSGGSKQLIAGGGYFLGGLSPTNAPVISGFLIAVPEADVAASVIAGLGALVVIGAARRFRARPLT